MGGLLFLLGIDFETSDDKPLTTNPTELGASLYEWWQEGSGPDDCDPQWKKHYSTGVLIYEPFYLPQTPKIVELTGITDNDLKERGQPTRFVFEKVLLPLLEKADFIFAHKVGFDKTVLEATAKRFEITIPKKEWICTLTNFNWPEKYTCKKLSHLALDHYMFEKLNPDTSLRYKASDLHRGEKDTELLMELILANYEIEDVIAYARKPFVIIRAFCIEPWKDAGVQTDFAKANGFTWQRCKYLEDHSFPKMWVQRIKEDRLQSLQELVANSPSPFRVEIIQGVN